MDIERKAALLEVKSAKAEYSEAHTRMVRRVDMGYDAWSLAAYVSSAERAVPKAAKRRESVRRSVNEEYVNMVDGKGNGRKAPRGSIINSRPMRRKGR